MEEDEQLSAAHINSRRNPIATAPIVWEGDVGGRDGHPKTVYRMKIDDEWIWFIGKENYEDNRNDFKILISSFSGDKISTEATGDRFRLKFDAATSDAIKSRLIEFFMGAEQKPFFPFTHPRAHCLGVSFARNWILTL